MRYKHFHTPAELVKMEGQRRDNWGRDRYRRENLRRLRAGEPLLEEYDKLTGAERRAAGLYEGYDRDVVPPGIPPDDWAWALHDDDKYRNHVPQQWEVERGYDIYGRLLTA